MQKRNPILWRNFDHVRIKIGGKIKLDPEHIACPWCGSVQFKADIMVSEGMSSICTFYNDLFVGYYDPIEPYDTSVRLISPNKIVCLECRAEFTLQELEKANAGKK